MRALRLASFLTLAGLLVCSVMAQAQTRPGRIGIIGPAEEPRFSEVSGGFKQGLHDQGYSQQAVEILQGKVARRDQAGLKNLVESFIQQRADLLFVIGSEMAKEARHVSKEIPIVFITPGDPVASGLLESLAQPGRNMTAMTFEYPELVGKRLELLREISRHIRRVLVIYDPTDASPRQSLMVARDSAHKLGVTLIERESRNQKEVGQALDDLDSADAVLSIPGGYPSGHYEQTIRAANARRLPTMFHGRTRATREALASYGTSDAEVAREAARLAAKILRGAKAGELPVERPTKLELVINLKTARQIGLTIPPNVLARADKVIK